MLSGGGGQPQRWDIVAAATASMGHRCGCPARLSSINVPSLRLRPRGWRPSARYARNPGTSTAGTGNRERKEPATGSPGKALLHLTPLPSRYVCQSQRCGEPGAAPPFSSSTAAREFSERAGCRFPENFPPPRRRLFRYAIKIFRLPKTFPLISLNYLREATTLHPGTENSPPSILPPPPHQPHP